ncbi:MAG: hypothetical protein ACK5SU_00260 [Phenylobacterium sp.]
MWSMPRNLRKIAAVVIVLMALAGFVSGVLGARDVAYLPGEAPVAATTAPAVTAPEVTPLPTDLPPPPIPEPEPEPEAPPPPERPPAPEEAPASPARPPASQDAVGDLSEGADAATTQPPPY